MEIVKETSLHILKQNKQFLELVRIETDQKGAAIVKTSEPLQVSVEGISFVLKVKSDGKSLRFITGDLDKKLRCWEADIVSLELKEVWMTKHTKKITGGLIAGTQLYYTDKYGEMFCLDISKDDLRPPETREDGVKLPAGKLIMGNFATTTTFSVVGDYLITTDEYFRIKIHSFSNVEELKHVIFPEKEQTKEAVVIGEYSLLLKSEKGGLELLELNEASKFRVGKLAVEGGPPEESQFQIACVPGCEVVVQVARSGSVCFGVIQAEKSTLKVLEKVQVPLLKEEKLKFESIERRSEGLFELLLSRSPPHEEKAPKTKSLTRISLKCSFKKVNSLQVQDLKTFCVTQASIQKEKPEKD